MRTVIVAYLDPVLNWLSAVIYADLIAHAADHFLVALQTALDFAPLEAVCAGFHHATGPGCRPTQPVPQLVRGRVISYCFSWSLRQLEFQVRYNLLLKWFAGYPLFAVGPDYSTLDRFEQWVIAHQHRTLFDEVLRQIERDFPDQRHQPQIGDTFALRANAAKESLVELLRHTARLLLHDLKAAAPESHQRVLAHVDPVTVFGPADERDDYWLTADEKRQRLATTVQAVGRCTHAVREELAAQVIAEPLRTHILTRLAHLDKIVANEVCLTIDEARTITTVTELDKDDKGSFRLGSATDPEATYRVHGEKKTDFGYNVNVAINDQVIREINAVTDAQPDASGVPTLIAAQVDHHALQPDKFIYDAAAGTGKARTDFQAATGGRTQLVAPIPASSCGRQPTRFTPDDFTLSDDGTTLTCPNGHTPDVAFRHGAGDGRAFRFTDCADCPLIKQCRTP